MPPSKAYVIYTAYEAHRNAGFLRLLQASCTARGIDLQLLVSEHIQPTPHEPPVFPAGIQDSRFILMRAGNANLSRALEQMGCRVANPSVVTDIAEDKYKTYGLAKRLGIPVMETELYTPAIPLQVSFVAKPRTGKGGRGVYAVTTPEQAESLRPILAAEPYLIQQSAAESKDLRVYVVGGEIAASILRTPQEGAFRANYSLGGNAAVMEPSDEIRAIVRTLSEFLHPDYVGFDFLFHNGQPVLNEIEDAVGARMVYALTNINIADLYISHVAGSTASGR
ncbi:MAG: ATP-grasp domain-containing protein [Oscillospiraceae bacterium]|jgi:RimK family alpha-L-glutamate ligase|nr:ATP-grasp domain-containing protein [Oscillospiraceae bacterium]